jgi:dephospho-CoA kinase
MGKSEVAKTIRSMHIPVFDADATVRNIYENGTAAKALAKICPEAIDGKNINRKILSALIVKRPELLAQITTVIHPIIHRAEREFLAQQTTDFAVIDSPLILESGRAREMDVLIVVSSTQANQRERALARPGMTADKLNMILSQQMPDDEKRKWADYVIENNGTLEELSTVTRSVISEIVDKLHA